MATKNNHIKQKMEISSTGSAVVKRGEQTIQVHEGPLPAPDTFEGYERILPGSADRILCMAEKEQAARHKAQDNLFADLKRQRVYTLIHALAICGVAFFAIYHQ